MDPSFPVFSHSHHPRALDNYEYASSMIITLQHSAMQHSMIVARVQKKHFTNVLKG